MIPAPTIAAEFIVGKNGDPQFIEQGDTKHYKIRLSIKDPPPGLNRVSYRLHPTFRQPVREVPMGVPNFEESITSFGDFDLTAILMGYERIDTTTRNLTEALRQTYAGNPAPAIQVAIADIAAK